MPTIEELGRKVKAKCKTHGDLAGYRHFKKYEHLDDTAAGFAWKAAYPGDYEEYQGHDTPPPVEAPLEIRQNTTPSNPKKNSSLESSVQELIGDLREYDVDPKLEQNLQVLHDYYDPRSGVFNNWRIRRKSEARTRNLLQLTTEHLEVLRQGALLEDAIRDGKRKEIDFRMFIANNALLLAQMKAMNFLIDEALKEGRTVENDQHIKLEDALSSVRTNEARKISDIKVNEHQKITRIDLDNKIEEAENTVRIAIINKHLTEHQEIIMIQGLIDQFIEQIAEIKTKELPEELKDEMTEFRRAHIRDFTKNLDARKARLIQIDNGQEV